MPEPVRSNEDLARMSTMQLVTRAVEDARELARAEIALAKQDVRAEVTAALRGARELAIAYGCTVLGVALIVAAISIDIGRGAVALFAGIVAIVAAGILGGLGYAALPKRPLESTRRRITDDIDRVKEHVA
jgi:hypothetical protein